MISTLCALNVNTETTNYEVLKLEEEIAKINEDGRLHRDTLF